MRPLEEWLQDKIRSIIREDLNPPDEVRFKRWAKWTKNKNLDQKDFLADFQKEGKKVGSTLPKIPKQIK